MYKVDDIVWAKISKYSITFYHRPCRVLEVVGYYLKVEVLDNGSIFTVEKDKFEIITHDKIINCGDKVYHKELKEYLTFISYIDSDIVKCKDLSGNLDKYNIKNICKVGYLFHV